MKFKTLIIALLFSSGVYAQQTVTLQQCWTNARANMPALKTSTLHNKLDSLEQLILRSNYFPKLKANAQATWQSDVTSVDIDNPMFSIDEPSQEQYKAYVEVNQLVWDGGRTHALREKSTKESLLASAETEVAFYSVKERVASLYFALMLSQKQMEITNQLIETLDKKLSEIDQGVKQGVIREAGKYVLQAEKLQAEQDLANQQFQSKGVANMLNVLTGMSIQYTDSLEKPDAQVPQEINRKQLEVFQLQKDVAQQGKSLLKKDRMPVVNIFAQGGYGKPGLNMLKNEADYWLLAGAGVSWTIFDWNKSKRKQEQLTVQQQMIDHSREQFVQQVNTERQQYLSAIDQYKEALQKDNEIIQLRQKITADYSSQLKQGTVTSSAYVEELFKEQAALITREIHAIKLNQSQIALQILLEK